MISRGVFFIFWKCWFYGFLGGSNGKKWSKITKYLSVALHISGTIHQIVIYGTHAWNNNIFTCFFLFKILILWFGRRVKGQKNSPKWQKILSVVLNISCSIHHVIHVSGTIHHVIVIYGAHVENDNISRRYFYFFNGLIFLVHRRGKVQKTFQSDKEFCLLCSIPQEPYIMWLSFMVHMCKMIIYPGVLFSIFRILIF